MRRAPPSPDQELDDFGDSSRPSKSALKRQSHDLQSLGLELSELPVGRIAALALPESLSDALLEFRRIRSHEGRRRQLQLIGKLMRQVDPEPVREAVAAFKLGSAKETLALHEAERWRDDLIARDEALSDWLERFPETDAQQLRSLVRQARKDKPAPDQDAISRGLAPRQSRAYREVFQLVREQLRAAQAGAEGEEASDDEDAED